MRPTRVREFCIGGSRGGTAVVAPAVGSVAAVQEFMRAAAAPELSDLSLESARKRDVLHEHHVPIGELMGPAVLDTRKHEACKTAI